MTAEELSRRVKAVIEEFPPGLTVWHRANAKRGVIVEYAVDATGCVMVVIDTGEAAWDKCVPCVLTLNKPSDGTDGDEWREGTEESRA